MPVRLEGFKPRHIALLHDCGAQEWLRPAFASAAMLEEAAGGIAFSGFAGPDFLGAAGIVPVHRFRAIAWALLVPGFTKHFLEIHRWTKRFLDDELSHFPRIEAYIDPDFPQGPRWAKALGFREECGSKPYFFPDGRSGAEWVLIGGEE